MEKTIFDVPTVTLDDDSSSLLIIDQTLLPGELKQIALKEQPAIHEAIYKLRVRGAPAIGVAAAHGIYLAAKALDMDDTADFAAEFLKARDYLKSSRPTAVNLAWALERMTRVMLEKLDEGVPAVKAALLKETLEIQREDEETCRAIGEYGLSLLKPGDGLLTHCNAGQLATSRYGTATAPMYLGHERGYGFHIFCDETRPLLQGARLTATELSSAGMDVTLICDNMAATVLKKGLVDAIFVGCDRVAMNGDTANKIGTMPLAIAAKRFGVPFYVCAPTSTIDPDTATGDGIVIEERPAEEVSDMWYRERMTGDRVKVFNPAFDVTDAELITAFVTEKGILKPPFDISLATVK
ncbi:MAG: S-methyl-5-thioribose-1-phosphate isomerase [Selenomonadaceae bacterium]|nr:S-methyl-5-thioribose-1-phosphate isomerase [Selenomonadaceae bacterium]